MYQVEMGLCNSHVNTFCQQGMVKGSHTAQMQQHLVMLYQGDTFRRLTYQRAAQPGSAMDSEQASRYIHPMTSTMLVELIDHVLAAKHTA